MQRARRYPHLRFAPGVDWQHVQPTLLSRLNRAAALAGVTVTVISGYRTDKHSQEVGGFAGDPHTRHVAVDALVGNKPVGLVIPLAVFKRVGLISGNQPNFYRGKPDPGHVQLPRGAEEAAAQQPGTEPQPEAQAAQPPASAPVPDVQPSIGGPAPLPDPSIPEPPILAPGTVKASGFTQRSVAELWRIIASQPSASLDSQNYATLAGGSGANQP